MTDWRTAKRLLTLLAEVNKLYPGRIKASDGTIGDEAHRLVKSEHNPDRNGVVRALDITIPVSVNVDGMELAKKIIENRDACLWYVIVQGQIWEEGKWSKYNGKDQHYGHLHVSLYDKPALYDNTGPWLLKGENMKMTVGEMDSLKFLATRQKVTKPEIDKYQNNLAEYIQYLTRVQAEHNVAPLVVDQTAQAQLEKARESIKNLNKALGV